MDSGIVSSLIVGISSIIGGIVSGWVAIKIKDKEIKAKERETGQSLTQSEKKTAHWLWGIGGTLIGIATTLIVLLLLGVIPGLSIPASPYDDFNSPKFDGSYNEDLWSRSNSAGLIEQRNGILEISYAYESGSDGPGLDLIPKNLSFRGVNFLVEGKLMLSERKIPNQGSGDKHLGGIHLGVQTGLTRDRTWLAHCIIDHSQTAKKPVMECQIISYGEGISGIKVEYETKYETIEYGDWHTVRVEIDTEAKVHFFIDGQEVGSHTPKDAVELRNATFRPLISLYNEIDIPTVGYVDDIRLGNLE